ncbi:hypothetical protein M8J75_000164 [Diaphorina citri]|nr:hypothetical protein M8J75_000164 [Diaphorina citri]
MWRCEQQRQRRDTIPTGRDAAPTRRDTIPPRRDTIPPRRDTIPPRRDAIPPERDTIPTRRDTIPPKLRTPHPQEGIRTRPPRTPTSITVPREMTTPTFIPTRIIGWTPGELILRKKISSSI